MSRAWLVVASLGLAGCGQSAGEEPGTGPTGITEAGAVTTTSPSDAEPVPNEGSDAGSAVAGGEVGQVAIAVPTGWAIRRTDAGITATPDPGALDADVPVGPRLRLFAADPALDAVDSLSSVPTGLGSDFDVVGEPEAVDLGGLPAVRMLWRDGDRGAVVEQHVLLDDHGASYLLVTEAPLDAWPDPDLRSVIASVRLAN